MELRSNTKNGLSADIVRSISKPIDDLDQRASGKYSPAEAEIRKKLACAYRLVDLFGWSEGIYNHLTARTETDHVLLNPFGVLFHEVTASSLVKVTLDGEVVDPGSTSFGFNPRAFTLHSAIHGERKDVVAAVHLHIPEVMAMSSTDLEWLPLFQESQFLGPVSSLDFSGILTDLGERKAILDALGTNNAMLLKNHGFVTCGVSVEDAFTKAWWMIYAIQAMVKMMPIPQDRWTKPSEEAVERSYNHLKAGELLDGVQWEPGELNWQAWMRALDDMGLNTGYNYRKPLWRN
jgi:adducin